MSHFAVLVVGEDYEEQLSPFQENNMGDCPEEFLEFVDCTEEVTKDWEEKTSPEWWPEASLQETEIFDVKFADEQTVIITTRENMINFRAAGIEKDERIKFRRFGADETFYAKVLSNNKLSENRHSITGILIEGPKESPHKEQYPSIEKFAKEYHGYSQEEDGRFGYWHNPNTKWDWYTVGGRWRNYLKLKPADLSALSEKDIKAISNGHPIDEIKNMAELFQTDVEGFTAWMNKFKDPDKANSIFRAMFRYLAALYPYENEAGRGELSVFDQMDKEEGKLSDLKLLSQSIGYCDATYKKNIDVEAMEAPLREPAAKKWEEFHEKRAQLDGKSYADFMKDVPKPSVDEPFRKHYEKFPDEMKKWSDNNLGFFGGYNDLERIATLSKEDYVACMSAWSPYALLWEGKWYGKGDMGWWGISSNEENQWTGTFKELWAQIDGDEWVTVVDCHI